MVVGSIKGIAIPLEAFTGVTPSASQGNLVAKPSKFHN